MWSPAALAGLRTGDHIRTVNGVAVTSPEVIEQQELAAHGQPVTVTGTHADGTAFSVVARPLSQNGACQMGVGIARITTPLTAIQDGATFPWQAFQVIVQGLGSLVSGKIQGGLFGSSGLTGPIGIAALTAGAVNQVPAAPVTLRSLLFVPPPANY